MTGLTLLAARCLFEHINGQASTIGRKRSLEIYLGNDLAETTEYASIQKTIHRGYTLTKCSRVNWMKFDHN